ncbi:hypothetical protein ACIBG8_10805 [Nonomuraea sp. NPDC050556]|uniref:hypothetical protein n=1 Tax=Nonomuraea sp. NPDC050556 TaxID=3364369 RepID=UPI0037BD51F8
MPRAYALFWWLTAAGWTMWTLADSTLSALIPSTSSRLIFCDMADRTPEWALPVEDFLWLARPVVELATPVLLLLLAWAATRMHALWSAAAGTGLVAFGYVAVQGVSWLSPLPEDATCGVDPDTLGTMSMAAMAWTFLPAALILLAARAQIGPFPWRAVGAIALTAALVAGVVLAVRLAPEAPAGQTAAQDGTPRYALVLSGRRIVVADLQTGGDAGTVPTADPRLYNYRAVARDVAPGHYLAAASTHGTQALDGGDARSRIYRVTVAGNGDAAVGERVGPEFKGVVTELAAAEDGTIAYTRVTGDFEANRIETIVGVVGGREWSLGDKQGLEGEKPGVRWSGPTAQEPPDTRELVAYGEQSLRVHTRGGRPRGPIALDPSGRYLLTARVITDDSSYELVRIDLGAPGKPSAAPWSPEVTMGDLPEKVVWAAERDVSGLAW